MILTLKTIGQYDTTVEITALSSTKKLGKDENAISYKKKNRKYRRNFDRKQTENIKGLSEGQKLPEKALKKSQKYYKYIFFNIILKINIKF